MATVVNGSSCLFWLDTWNGLSLSTQMPELFSYAKDSFITVKQFCQTPITHDLFYLPLSEEAYQQYTQLLDIVDSLSLQDGFDLWTYIWNSNIFTSKKAYRHLSGTIHVHPAFS